MWTRTALGLAKIEDDVVLYAASCFHNAAQYNPGAELPLSVAQALGQCISQCEYFMCSSFHAAAMKNCSL